MLTHAELAGTLAAQGRITEARTDLESIHDMQSRALGYDHWRTQQTRDMLNQLAPVQASKTTKNT